MDWLSLASGGISTSTVPTMSYPINLIVRRDQILQIILEVDD